MLPDASATTNPFTPDPGVIPLPGESTRSAAEAWTQVPMLDEDVRQRSMAFAKKLAENRQIPHSEALPFINPVSNQTPGRKLAAVRNHLGGLMIPLAKQATLSPVRFELHERLLDGMTLAVDWLFQNTHWNSDRVFERLVFQAMLPLYGVTSLDFSEQCAGRSVQLIRRTIAFQLWCDFLGDPSIYQWLTDDERKDVHPRESVLQCFRICLDELSRHYWKSLFPDSLDFVPPLDAPFSSESEPSNWEVTNRLSAESGETFFSEQESFAGFDWEGVQLHWRQLTYLLANQPTEDEPNYAIPISSKQDSLFAGQLQGAVQLAREEDCGLSLAVIHTIESNRQASHQTISVDAWQTKFMATFIENSDLAPPLAFVTELGELIVILHELERSEVSYRIRDTLERLKRSEEEALSETPVPLVAGVASVSSPAKAFAIETLMDSAWRCLDAAMLQGSGAVKSIQVY